MLLRVSEAAAQPELSQIRQDGEGLERRVLNLCAAQVQVCQAQASLQVMEREFSSNSFTPVKAELSQVLQRSQCLQTSADLRVVEDQGVKLRKEWTNVVEPTGHIGGARQI